MEFNYANIWIVVLVFVLGILIWKLIYETYVNKKEKRLNEKLDKIESEYVQRIDQAEQKAEQIIQQAEQKAADKIKQADKEYEQKLKRVDTLEERVSKKEETLEKKFEELNEKKEQIKQQQKELQEEKERQTSLLQEISWYTKEQAKQELMGIVENESSQEMTNFLNKQKMLRQETANKDAAEIISKVLPRVGTNQVSEFTISIIDLPNEETKWKIIWKEWRNISFFEKLTWAEIIIDDSPLVVNVSCFDSEKRYIAAETLKRLVKDWRINPVYIEKFYNEVSSQMPEFILDKWKEAVSMLNLPMFKSDILEMIWQFYFRYSYWQNLLIHSIEVARIAEWIANELGLDWQLAKKAGLLHDIWKIKWGTWVAHAKVWSELLKQYWFDEVTINATEWHHFDVELTNPISWIVASADIISAARPWARFNTKNMFIERMENLEKLISEFEWINKVYIMQAGREIMTFVDAEKIDDLKLEKLVKTISEKIEEQLDYPGNIRIVWIRETKVTSYIK